MGKQKPTSVGCFDDTHRWFKRLAGLRRHDGFLRALLSLWESATVTAEQRERAEKQAERKPDD